MTMLLWISLLMPSLWFNSALHGRIAIAYHLTLCNALRLFRWRASQPYRRNTCIIRLLAFFIDDLRL